jgi:hypothetical protein
MQDAMQQVEIPRAEARQSYLDYRRAAKREDDPVIRNELEAMARAFRIAAKEEHPLIALTPTLTRGGTVPRTIVQRRGRDEYRTHYLLPRLAVCNAAARFVFTLGVERDGAIRFIDSLGRSPRYQRGRIELETGFELPDGYEVGSQINWDRSAWSALVPIVPPKHRPARGALENFVVLWEVDDWTWRRVPAPPGDPALLQHVGGDIYAVLATWDLSPLEQLVLSGRKLEEAIF